MKQAIKNHKFVELFEEPGASDISAWVDFSAMRKEIDQFPKLKKYGPVSQSHFLEEMGIQVRLASLLKNANPLQAQHLISSYERLVDSEAMGATYKAFAFSSSDVDVPGLDK